MGFSCKAKLVVGISMSKLFVDFKEVNDVFDEHDKYGKKTGRQFKEEKLLGELPNGRQIIISEKKTNRGFWGFNWYDSLGFIDGEYCGDLPNVEVKIHYADYDTVDMDQIIVGIEVCETDSSNSGNNFVVKVDEDITNTGIERCKKNLAELYGYLGEINLYLINSLSY